jgi:uncharacterized membrane protein
MAESNINSRLEAFCDGVFAIALTLLIIEIKVPSSENINTTNDLWLALKHLLPSIFAFLLSFVIVFITWVNHHAVIKLVNKSSSAFIYANGFLLLTVVIIPFPTALLGEYLFTDQAGPAVVLYSVINGLQSIAWIFLSRTALKPNPLTKNEKSTLLMRGNHRNGYFALAAYTLCTFIAFWFPLVIALLLSVIWLGWLIYGINLRSE